MKVSDVVRICLTIGLLAVVWLNTHWSVALCLTLISISIELENINRQR